MPIEKKKSTYEDDYISELSELAWHNINQCCETLCEREAITSYILYLESKIAKLQDYYENSK